MKPQVFFSTKNFYSLLSGFCGLFLYLFLLGCSAKTKSSNFYSQLDTIDSLISQNQMADAIGDLKKLEKNVYDSWGYIGIYKRYALLGEDKLAEKILKTAIKKNPKNPELTAVYAAFLNRHNRFAEAEKIGKDLKSTRYASIFAESVFRNHKDEISASESKILYGDAQYYDLFFNSYQASKNPVWIRNCAIYYLCQGLYESASNLAPIAFNDADDAYFWALVKFDAGRYLDSINLISKGFDFLASLGKKSAAVTSEIKLTALASDSYMAISDMLSAQRIRDVIVTEYITAEPEITKLTEEDRRFLPLLLVNSAISANESGDDYFAADLLSYVVLNFPEYVPGLICYADFAYNSNLERREDDEMVALRNAGTRSREMERYDNRAKIPLSDAIARIDHALAVVNDPYLYITKLDLRYKTDASLTVRNKTADLWRLLEQSSSETVKYHDVLVLYAVNFLLETNQVEDAEEIFRKYMRSKLGLKIEDDFFEQISSDFGNASIEDLETAAWFAVSHKKVDEAIQLYEYCVFGHGGTKTNDISQKVSTQSAMNLANVYFSLGDKEKSLDLYGRIVAREKNPTLRSEIFYRIASIYYAFGDNQEALRAVDYSYSINPKNAKAHLLKTKLK